MQFKRGFKNIGMKSETTDTDKDDVEWIRAFGIAVRYTDAAAGQETISVDGDDFIP